MSSFICLYCKQPYIPKFKPTQTRPRKYCSTLCQRTHRAEEVRRENISKYNETPKVCECCGAEIPYDQRNNKFCSHKCAAKITNKLRPPMSDEQRKKHGETLKNYRIFKKSIKPSNISWCKYCGAFLPNTRRIMCDLPSCREKMLRTAGQRGGRISAQKQIRRSKGEIELFQLCKQHFKKCEHNIPLVGGWDADIIIYDTKTAILWNGPWHYRNMNMNNHSLLQVQTRDRIKIEELKRCGWNVFVFQDDKYTPKTAFSVLVAEE